MAVTTDEILARGNGPVQQTWADQIQPTLPPTPPQQPVADNEPSGVENVSYDTVTNQGAPDNPKNAREVVERGVDDRQKGSQAAGAPKLSYTEMYEKMSPYKPPTPEDLERERKRQKREAIFAAIGEGISAMSNLYFTTQYAPNAFDPTSGMAATTKARFDKLKKDREDNQREYMNGYFRAMQMDDNAGYKELLSQMKEREQNRKESETNISIALKQAELDYKEAKKDGQTYINELYRLKGQAMEAGMSAQVALIEEKIKTEKAKQQKYHAAGSGGRGGDARPGEYPWYDADGNKHYAHSYEAMRQNAIDHGTWNEQTQESSSERITTDRRGKTKGTTSSKTTKPGKGHSSAPQGKKPNPMGSSEKGGKKKPNPMS